MVAVAEQIIQQTDFIAQKELDIQVGSDGVLRVNVDGICAIRVRMVKGRTLIEMKPSSS